MKRSELMMIWSKLEQKVTMFYDNDITPKIVD